MTIDHTTEMLVSFKDARLAFPGSKNLSLQTLHRWRLHGVAGVQLETVLIGGRRFTSREAINRFIKARNPVEQAAPVITPSQRRRQAETANRLLIEAGI